MAKFIYKLQNVLNIKERLETQAKTEFAEAMNRVSIEEEKLKALIERRNTYIEDVRRLSSGRLNVALVRRCNEYIKTIEEFMNQQAVVLRIAQKNLEKCREKLNEAVQDRKIHEKLKEKAFEEFKLELNVEEKKEIDQLVSFTYNDKSGRED